jgi:tetratricopeptide (TPR) repeat protein
MRSFTKIIFIAFVSISLLIPSVSAQEDKRLKFSKGIEEYTAARYQEALKEWLDIYNTGYRSAELCYNIGNAYFKVNNIPGAVLFYERARLMKPGDGNINYNLQITRSLVKDKFEEIPELFFVKWFDYMALLVSSNKWAWTSILMFVSSLFLLSAYIYSRQYRIKVLCFWAALFFFTGSAFSLSLTARNRTLVFGGSKAVIFAPSVNGKSSPDTSGTDLFLLHEGTKVSISDKLGEWYEIKLSDGNKGWVPSNTLEII